MSKLLYLPKEFLEGLKSYKNVEKIRASYLQLFIILCGLFSSVWTYFLHVQLQTQAGSPLICDINETINCSKIIGSQQGELFSIPLGVLGIMFWSIALGLYIYPYFSKASTRYIRFWRLLLSSIGLLSALSLIYISYFVLKGVCELCSIVQASCILYFINSLSSYYKSSGHYASKSDFIKLITTIFTTSFLPFLIYLAVNTTIYKFYINKNNIATSISEQNNSQIAIPFSPVLDSKDIDYSKGDDNAPVTIVEFTDFECPYCQLLHERLNKLKKYITSGKVKIYFRNWPLTYHQHATTLAIAARCAGEQNRFWPFAGWAFENAKRFARNAKAKNKLFSTSGILLFVAKLKIDIEQFKNCTSNPKTLAKITKDSADAKRLNGKGTPFLLINNGPYKGNWMKPNTLEQYIDGLLTN